MGWVAVGGAETVVEGGVVVVTVCEAGGGDGRRERERVTATAMSTARSSAMTNAVPMIHQRALFLRQKGCFSMLWGLDGEGKKPFVEAVSSRTVATEASVCRQSQTYSTIVLFGE